jgi:hypothetical protein
MIGRRIHGLVLAGALIWACGNPTDGCGCPPEPPTAIVHGHIQLASGAPAVSATVSAYIAQADGCIARNFPDGQTQTQSNGNYTLGIASGRDTAAVCVLVRVRPPNGSGISAVVDTTLQLAFRSAPPLDSAEVNATLGSSP